MTFTAPDAPARGATPATPVRGLAPRLAAVLDLVHVRRDGCEATVAGRSVTADSHRDLRGRLTNALYEEFHAGREASDGSTAAPPRRTLRDPGLEQRLAAAVPHATTPVKGRLIEVLSRPDGDQLVVRLPEITARVTADRLRSPDAPKAGDTVELALEAARPALSPGFFYVTGSLALPRPAGAVRRVFVHAPDAGRAVVLWGAVLTALEEARARYHAKVLSDPQDFPRRDGLVVYLHGDHRDGEDAAVAAARATSATGAGTSLFTEERAAGVAAAWDPRDPRPGQSGMSFGQHRSFALATALISHSVSPWASREEHVVRAFREAGIDPLHPENNITVQQGEPT